MNKGRPNHLFWWSIVRLDSDPLGRHRDRLEGPCKEDKSNCVEFDPLSVHASPGWLDKVLLYSALPVFLVEMLLLGGLGRSGVNQLVAFFVSMPLLIAAWFYFIGRLLDRWRYKRALKKASITV